MLSRRDRTIKPENLEDRLMMRIARKRGDVFLRADFRDLGGYDQVGRGLRQLVREGRLLKIGYGLYTRARPSLLDGKPTPSRDFAPWRPKRSVGSAVEPRRHVSSRPTTPAGQPRCRRVAWSPYVVASAAS